MKIKIYLHAQRFENYDFHRINIKNPFWKPEGKKLFEIEIDHELLENEFINESKRNKVFSNIVNSYSDNYEKYEYLTYSFNYETIKISNIVTQRYLLTL